MKNMTFNCNDVIFKQGDFAETMYDVVSGKVGVYADFQTDKEQLLACFGPGETFGEMGMLEVYPRSATAVALEDGTVIAEIAEPELTEYFQNAPEMLLNIMRQLSKRIRETNDKYVNACRAIYENEKGAADEAQAEWVRDELQALTKAYEYNAI